MSSFIQINLVSFQSFSVGFSLSSSMLILYLIGDRELLLISY